MDDAELVKRLLVNAQTMEVMSEGAESPFSRAAKNQRDAASRIESLSTVIARVESVADRFARQGYLAEVVDEIRAALADENPS